jgi:predicted TIM-barrel fold metal-dependent hydrolase
MHLKSLLLSFEDSIKFMNSEAKIQTQSRREVLQVMGAATITAMGLEGCAQQPVAVATEVRYSSGTEPPKTQLPINATDCHHHIYDARFPADKTAVLKPKDAYVSDYRALQKRLGLTRNVIVQPSTYGTDNRVTLEAMAVFGLQNCRGVAVVNTEVSDAQLKMMHEQGIRGIRFNLAQGGVTSPDMAPSLAKRIAPMGWHLQVNAPPQVIFENKAIWSNLPIYVVFDHQGHMPHPNAMNHPTFGLIQDLIQKDKAYVKLTGFYNETKVGPPSYSDSAQVASVYAKDAPERCVWGTDWPHPTEGYENKPNDAYLLDAFAQAVPNEKARNKILVDNPARLYQFS